MVKLVFERVGNIAGKVENVWYHHLIPSYPPPNVELYGFALSVHVFVCFFFRSSIILFVPIFLPATGCNNCDKNQNQQF